MRSPEGAFSPLRPARLRDRCVGGRLRLRLHAGPLRRELCKMLPVALVLGPRLLGLSMLSPRLFLC